MIMQKTYFYTAILLLCLSSFSNAQKVEKAKTTQEQTAYLKVIQENALAKNFYDELQDGEKKNGNKWTLAEAYFFPKSELTGGANIFGIRLNNVRNEILIDIRERENNSRFFVGPISQGRMEKCVESFCGDEGVKVFGGNGKFHSLEFKKHNFQITITCNSEKIAMRFADYALKAIAENIKAQPKSIATWNLWNFIQYLKKSSSFINFEHQTVNFLELTE